MSNPTQKGLALGGRARCALFTNSSITCGYLSGIKYALYLRPFSSYSIMFSEVASPRLMSRTIGLGLLVQNLFGLALNLLIPYLIQYARIST